MKGTGHLKPRELARALSPPAHRGCGREPAERPKSQGRSGKGRAPTWSSSSLCCRAAFASANWNCSRPWACFSRSNSCGRTDGAQRQGHGSPESTVYHLGTNDPGPPPRGVPGLSDTRVHFSGLSRRRPALTVESEEWMERTAFPGPPAGQCPGRVPVRSLLSSTELAVLRARARTRLCKGFILKLPLVLRHDKGYSLG